MPPSFRALTAQWPKRSAEACLLGMALASTISFTTWRLMLDNFVVTMGGFGGEQIGMLQSIREVPGLLSFLSIFVLFLMKERTLALLSLALLGIGVAITGYFPTFLGLCITTSVMSIGFHFFEAMNMSLTLQWLPKGTMPIVSGRIMAASSFTALLIYVAVFSAQTLFEVSFLTLYAVAGMITVFLVALVWKYSQGASGSALKRPRLILRRRYWLFYALTFMGGARRQIFVVFGGFMMVSIFGVDLSHMALIYFSSHLATMFLAPRIGTLISVFGERLALRLEYGGLIVIFSGYAFVALRGPHPYEIGGLQIEAWWLCALFFVLDHLFFSFSVAIKSYFQRIAAAEDIPATASISFSINHIAAVVLPAALGSLYAIAPHAVFLVGMAMAMVSLLLASNVPRHPSPGAEVCWPRTRV